MLRVFGSNSIRELRYHLVDLAGDSRFDEINYVVIDTTLTIEISGDHQDWMDWSSQLIAANQLNRTILWVVATSDPRLASACQQLPPQIPIVVVRTTVEANRLVHGSSPASTHDATG